MRELNVLLKALGDPQELFLVQELANQLQADR